MGETRRVEAKALPVEVYNSMRMILKHTGESQSAFINRAIRAEVERRGRIVQLQIASRETLRIREERLKKASLHHGSKEVQRREANRIASEEAALRQSARAYYRNRAS